MTFRNWIQNQITMQPVKYQKYSNQWGEASIGSPRRALEVPGPVRNDFWLEDVWFSWIPPLPSLTDQVSCPYITNGHVLDDIYLTSLELYSCWHFWNEKSSYLFNLYLKTKSKDLYIRMSPKLRLPHKKSHLSLSNCNSKFFIVCTCDGSLGGNAIKLNCY